MALGCMASVTSCENGEVEFGDYDYQTVYFAHQTPIRPIVLGDDIFDRTLDNEHRFKVYATVGGVESNKTDRTLQIVVDPTLCKDMTFSNGDPVLALPDSYYTLGANTITIPKGNIMGAVDVKLSDAFFADAKATSLNYVLPIRITSCADSVLNGKDYTLYGLYYINQYDGAWLCHGIDNIDLNGTVTSVVRDAEYVENYEVRGISTRNLRQCVYPLSTSVEIADGKTVSVENLNCELILTFDEDGNCTVSTESENCEAEGTGKWVRGGAKKAWGDKDRDQLKLEYTVTYHYSDNGTPAYKKFTTSEELIMRDRRVNKLETF